LSAALELLRKVSFSISAETRNNVFVLLCCQLHERCLV
jgi:hypothetical protein